MHAEKTIIDKFCSRLAHLGIDIFGIAQDEAKWITVHPGGTGRRADGDGMKGGTHVLIDSETGQILGGMGGKHNGKTIAEVKQETKEKKLTQKQVAAISAKEQQKAYGKGFYDGQKTGVITETSPEIKSLIDKYHKAKKIEEAQKKAVAEGNHTKAYKLQSELINANKELMDELYGSSDEIKKAFHAWGKKESMKQEEETQAQSTIKTMQDKTDAVLALPPTANNLETIQNIYGDVQKEMHKLKQEGKTDTPEYEQLKKLDAYLTPHYIKAQEDATKAQEQANAQQSLQSNQNEHSPAFIEAAQAKLQAHNAWSELAKGTITDTEYAVLEKKWYDKLDALSPDEKQKLLDMPMSELETAIQSAQAAGAAAGAGGSEPYTPTAEATALAEKVKKYLNSYPYDLSVEAASLAHEWATMHETGDTQYFDFAFKHATEASKKEFAAFQDKMLGGSGPSNKFEQSLQTSLNVQNIMDKHKKLLAAKEEASKDFSNKSKGKKLKEASKEYYDLVNNASPEEINELAEIMTATTPSNVLDVAKKGMAAFALANAAEKAMENGDPNFEEIQKKAQQASFDYYNSETTLNSEDKYKAYLLGSILAKQNPNAGQTKTTTQPEKYSPGVKEIATAFTEYTSAIEDLQKGKITKSEFGEKVKKFKNAKDKASNADKQKWEAMTDAEIKEAAAMSTAGIAGGTQTQTTNKSLQDESEAVLALPPTAENENAIYKQWEKVSDKLYGGSLELGSPEYKALAKTAAKLSMHYQKASKAKVESLSGGTSAQTQTSTSSKQTTHPMPKASDPEYSTPKGELSPVPQSIAWNTGSPYLNSLKGHNFPTTDNPTGTKKTGVHAKQGFTQAAIPTQSDMVSRGFYGDGQPPAGYWDGVPHVKNAHPDLEPLNGATIDVPDDVKKAMLKGSIPDSYRKSAHNNVPYAAAFGTASGRAAAYAYTVKSYGLDRILRGKSGYDDMEYAGDAAQVTRELDKMLSVSRTKEPMVVYRGIHGMGETNFFNEYKLGAVIEDKGFMSTSIDPNASSGFAGSGYGLFKILVPKGASAMSLRYQANGKSFSGFPSEDEILLPRNTKYRVVGFEKGTGSLSQYKKIPIVEIIP